VDFPLWLWAVPAGSFVVLEALAIANQRNGDTASELLRVAAGIKPARPWRPLGIAAIAGFCTWLVNHLISG
jgi:hypothetical protein